MISFVSWNESCFVYFCEFYYHSIRDKIIILFGGECRCKVENFELSRTWKRAVVYKIGMVSVQKAPTYYLCVKTVTSVNAPLTLRREKKNLLEMKWNEIGRQKNEERAAKWEKKEIEIQKKLKNFLLNNNNFERKIKVSVRGWKVK